MNIAVREADRLNLLITDFLTYARPMPADPTPQRLANVVDEVLEMLDVGGLTGVKLERGIDPDLMVLADAGQLRQILWNLCLNAEQAMPEGGCLRISAARIGKKTPQERGPMGRNENWNEPRARVEICVADTGVGIPPDVLERIFDPFFTTKADGTGLGLATVHRIVGENDGVLKVESTPGVGSSFRVQLPEAKETA
jgi:two-component system sensor histidine kinase PilS (NtrC family)